MAGRTIGSTIAEWIPAPIRDRIDTNDDRVIGIVSLLPTALLISIVAFFPIAWAIYSSFFQIDTLAQERAFVGLQNYRDLLISDAAFWWSLGRAAYFAIGSTLLQLALAIPTAVLLNKQLKGVPLARAIALLPYLIPTIVVGMTFRWMMHADLGVFSVMLQNAGLVNEPVSFFGSRRLAMPSLIIANSWKFTAFMVMIFLARLQSIPESHYEAAIMCGANAWEQFRDVTLPNLRGVILLVVLLRSIWMFNKFDIIWILTQGGPVNATTTLPVYIYELAFHEFNMGSALAASTLLFGVLVLFGIAYLRIFNPADEVATR